LQGNIAQQTTSNVAHRLAGEIRNTPRPHVESGRLRHGHIKHETQIADGHETAA